jgi:hypothetical protein
MKADAVIVNPARGAVIDEAALYDALLHRRIGGAVIDTWWDYPATASPRDPSTRFPFHRLDNVLLSPHVAGWTTGTVKRRTLGNGAKPRPACARRAAGESRARRSARRIAATRAVDLRDGAACFAIDDRVDQGRVDEVQATLAVGRRVGPLLAPSARRPSFA